jgi:hypothetical protein
MALADFSAESASIASSSLHLAGSTAGVSRETRPMLESVECFGLSTGMANSWNTDGRDQQQRDFTDTAVDIAPVSDADNAIIFK